MTAEAQRLTALWRASLPTRRVSLTVNRQAERRARPHRHAAARVRPVDRGDHVPLVWRDVGGARCRRGGLEEQASQQPHPAHDGHPPKLSAPTTASRRHSLSPCVRQLVGHPPALPRRQPPAERQHDRPWQALPDRRPHHVALRVRTCVAAPPVRRSSARS